MVLPELMVPELPGMPVPAPLEVPLLPIPLAPPVLLPDEPDMPAEPESLEPALPVAPELSGMLPLLPGLLPKLLPPPDAPEPAAERPDIELHAASAHTHATSAICFIMKILLSLKDTAHTQPLNWQPYRLG